MKVKPLKNHLLVRLEKKENETKSGILLVGKELQDTNMAKIIETSDFNDEKYDILLKGDTVLIDSSFGKKVNINDEELLIIDQKYVLAVID